MITKQALGNTLFGMADVGLRDKVEDYKSYILSLLFFKRLSDNYTWETDNKISEHRAEWGSPPNEKQLARITAKAHDYKIPEGCFWADVREASQDDKNQKLHDALNGIANENQNLKGVINSVRWNEPSPDGSGGKRIEPEILTTLINYLNVVDLSNRNVSVDVLGDAYEYLIKRFADENKGGTVAGQFYTPKEVVDIIVRYLKPEAGNQIYDPTCGSGGFLINGAKYLKETVGDQRQVRLHGQESVWNTWAICRINMILHNLDADIQQGDTMRNPKFQVDHELETFDKIMANFPFSFENWWNNGTAKLDRRGRTKNKKDGSPQLEYPPKDEFSDPYNRMTFATPPFSNGDFAFLQHIVKSLNENGKAGVVCPQGVLFRGQPEKTEAEDGQNRKADDEYLIRRGFLGIVERASGIENMGEIIDAIVVLPGNLFYGTTIPGSILFFNKNKPPERRGKVLMVYAGKEGWYKEESNLNVLLPHDILRISTMLESWGDGDTAAEFMNNQKTRLNGIITDSLEFKLNEITEEYREDIADQEKRILDIETIITALTEKGRATKAKENQRDKAQEKLAKIIEKKQNAMTDAETEAEKERQALNDVEIEMTAMFGDPELRKRYFAIVNGEELEENEYNLNIPRYVDTFEPEAEIDLQEAIADFENAVQEENELNEIIGIIKENIN
jgi:type I restriction enzyme M protein